jgi:glycosyltransferase involved in cell wall biosynthesis
MPGSKISVILPNYNHAQYVGTAIERIRAQSHEDFELIVVDDGSTDESRRVIQSHADADPRVRLVVLPENRGVNAAATHGLAHASGDFLYLAAADDQVRPTLFQRSVEALEQFPAAGLCFSDPTVREESGRVTSFPLYLADGPIGFSPQELFERWRRSSFHLSSNTILFRRAAFAEVGGYDHGLDWLSDWFANTTVALRYGACYVPEALTELLVCDMSYSAANMKDPAKRKRVFLNALDKLAEPRFREERGRLIDAAQLPEFSLRALAWIYGRPEHRDMLTGRIVRRVFAHSAWGVLRPCFPAGPRRAVRRGISLLSRRREA